MAERVGKGFLGRVSDLPPHQMEHLGLGKHYNLPQWCSTTTNDFGCTFVATGLLLRPRCNCGPWSENHKSILDALTAQKMLLMATNVI